MALLATYDDLTRFRAVVPDEGRLLRSAATFQDKNTFLSHSSKDNELVVGAIELLERHGGRVYVDLGDTRLPATPSAETAEILRDAVKNTRRFVLLVTERSKDSAWMPWELGLADGIRGPNLLALLPVARTGIETWPEQEYLGLYQRIVFGRLGDLERPVWMVLDSHSNTGRELSEWLRSW